MSAQQTTTPPPASKASAANWGLPSGASLRRVRALARAELTLLLRNRGALTVSLLVPVLMIAGSWSTSEELDLAGTGLSRADSVLTGGIGMVLLLVVYLGLIPTYVTRREEGVLKRLRTGELSDGEILVGAAVPATALALAQCAVLLIGGSMVLDVSTPASIPLLLLGLVLGIAVLATFATVTAAVSRTVESAQVTGMPLLLVSAVGSGLYFPLGVLPDTLAEICRFLPLTPAVDLIRAGWTGGESGAEILGAMALAVAWTAFGVYAIRRRFRWEPRH
ncbi:ABC transporter permease [Streptomyces marincola]|uniref:ABC transmembrane type-2 domain-containing protein n=1 Tax=Streptomyces marincola TaxID=2878388 RepID=A0A1W7CXP2_9ACTN|nr:ABC transporter permease [Streptomyces marincola]ARQ69568.1 hypothetical protein CAG99_12455 [Streptomyces marincola]